MFFSRQPTPSVPSQGTVVIIGESPLAYLLADIVGTNAYTPLMYTRKKDSSLVDLPTSYTVQLIAQKNHQTHVSYTNTINKPVDFCLIASLPEHARTDFLLLENKFLKAVPTLNFSHFYNHTLLAQSPHENIFPAYFEGWLNFQKNTLLVLDHKLEAAMSFPAKTPHPFAPLFENSILNLTLSDPQKKIFWHHLIPYFLGNLILLNYRKSTPDVLKQQDCRELLNRAAKELCDLAKKDKESISETDVFSKIMQIPTTYKPRLSTPQNLHALFSLVPEVSKFTTPALYDLLKGANKY